ncbi:hypothetical protein [Deferribacter autotrophicus]|uniref:hypothetical protein n=1 Tax=Deferribacter autotrophicus TaxID=500465 RepID=UPI0011EF59DB|nr:hypothetical protein [Deferribacter autotrophicus]
MISKLSDFLVSPHFLQKALLKVFRHFLLLENIYFILINKLLQALKSKNGVTPPDFNLTIYTVEL